MDLGRELEHLERHVAEGDTDSYEATYAILNGSRILRALNTGDVSISKRAAGQWALEHLPVRWHVRVTSTLPNRSTVIAKGTDHPPPDVGYSPPTLGATLDPT